METDPVLISEQNKGKKECWNNMYFKKNSVAPHILKFIGMVTLDRLGCNTSKRGVKISKYKEL
jgi:hypothetical protein